MKTDYKRKQTSRLNALKSTGPKTREGKRRSFFTLKPGNSSNQQLRQEILTNREMLAPSAPESPNLNPQPHIKAQNEPVETNLPEDGECKPVETNLTGPTAPHIPPPLENRVDNPHSTTCRYLIFM